MEYYFTNSDKVDLNENKLVIDGIEFRHLAKVLRKKAGDKITVTDGERNIYHCEIDSTGKEKMICKILKKDFNSFEPAVSLSLYISPLRNSSRFEFAVEKAVELGAASIHPVITEFTVNKNSLSKTKVERMNKIVNAAMKQSQRCFLPVFHNSISLNELVELSDRLENKIVMYESSDDAEEIKIEKNAKEISILIGPEGGFSKEEIRSLLNKNWHVKSLGKRKLRAETAAIVSVHNLISKLN